MTRDKGYHIVCALIIALLIQSGVAAQEVIRKRPGEPTSSGKDSPLATFKELEKAWTKADAATLSRLVGDGKVFVNVMGIGQKGGYFSRPQLRYLFQQMFDNYTHTKFNFVKYHNLDEPGVRVYGVAHRSYRSNRSGKIYADKVYVTLKMEGTVWVVDEIKTTR